MMKDPITLVNAAPPNLATTRFYKEDELMIYGLTDEQNMIADTVRSFVEKEIYPHEDLVERTGEVPAEIAQEIKKKTLDLGFYACNFPESVGCAGLNHVEFALVERELGRGSMALNHFFGRPQNILMACEGEQVDRYLMPAVRGERMDALAMTEPGAGSDVRGMKCSAVRDGGDWVVNGTKHFISGAEHADFIIVFIATGEDETPRGPKKRITTFLVDRGTPGFTIRDGYKSVSHRGYKNMILEFDDCRLPDAQVLGEVDGGFEVMNTWLYATRITVAAMSVGRARRAFNYALDYAAQREQFGQPIGKFQGVSFQLADMITEIDAADLLTIAAADRLDKGLPANREIASAKLYASEMLSRVTDAAIQIHGGMGLMDDYPLERFWRDARVERIWDGTSEIQRHIISRDLLRPLGA
jgi:acyl-CoA dehydrogenase|tara:strand:- start:1812 stop:3053 length:1242 start_codon:yes stop_codon:yes gene_type:complete